MWLLLYAILSTGAQAQMQALPSLNPPPRFAAYDGRYSPRVTGSPGWSENKFSLATSLYKQDTDAVGANLIAGTYAWDQSQTLDSGATVPKDYSRLELGLQYQHQRTENRNWTLRGSIGYAGDKAFADLTYLLSASYGYPGSGRGYWILMVFMSNNNPIANYIPIPGFAYVLKTPTFSGMFGFPILSMVWTPVTPWGFSLSAYGPVVNLEAAYGDAERAQIFAAFNLTKQTFIPHVREKDHDRLVVEENKLGLGVRGPMFYGLRAEAQVGRSFGRTIYIGDSFTSRAGGSLNLASDWFVNLGLRY